MTDERLLQISTHVVAWEHGRLSLLLPDHLLFSIDSLQQVRRLPHIKVYRVTTQLHKVLLGLVAEVATTSTVITRHQLTGGSAFM